MTPEELMALADAYAHAYGRYMTQADATSEKADEARAALEEALTLTSQFGGL
jgi:hypothetical protein